MGADQTYIESTTELTALLGAGIINRAYFNQMNAHRFRYDPSGLPNSASAITWSNGVNVNNNYGLIWNPGEPNDDCSTESCYQILTTAYSASTTTNDITCYVSSLANGYMNGIGSCKRPMCGK